MRKSEKISRAILIFLIVVALVAVGLQIINEKTSALETTYEIITFTVALTAVIMAVLQGIVNARTTRDLAKITHELRESFKQIQEVDRDNDALRRTLRRDVDLDEEILAILREHGVSNDREHELATHIRKVVTKKPL
jgi:hypothetical protein